MKTSPILITGIPRSGATMIAATINLCGAFGGEMSKRGMYCNDRIREELVKPYLRLMGGDVNAQKSFPEFIKIPPNWSMVVDTIIREERYVDGPWMYKDSRISQMWPVWDKAYPNAKWVIVRRRTGDVVDSCMKTGYMNAHTEREGWLTMVHEYEQRFKEMYIRGIDYREIWPERMVDGDYKQLYDLLDWVGVTWNPEALKFVKTLLWGSRLKERRK